MSARASGGKVWAFAAAALVAGSVALMANRFSRGLKSAKAFNPVERLMNAASKPAVPRPGDGGAVAPFRLVDQDGAAVTEASLADRVWIADFVFTHCAGPCPAMTTAMQRLREELASVQNVAFVSFSVDPERDTPEVLAAYARRYGAPDPRWRLLTGDKGEVARVARDCFRVGLEMPEAGGDPNAILHSTRFVLVDRGLVVRGLYSFDAEGSDDAMAALRDDARALAAR